MGDELKSSDQINTGKIEEQPANDLPQQFAESVNLAHKLDGSDKNETLVSAHNKTMTLGEAILKCTHLANLNEAERDEALEAHFAKERILQKNAEKLEKLKAENAAKKEAARKNETPQVFKKDTEEKTENHVETQATEPNTIYEVTKEIKDKLPEKSPSELTFEPMPVAAIIQEKISKIIDGTRQIDGKRRIAEIRDTQVVKPEREKEVKESSTEILKPVEIVDLREQILKQQQAVKEFESYLHQVPAKINQEKAMENISELAPITEEIDILTDHNVVVPEITDVPIVELPTDYVDDGSIILERSDFIEFDDEQNRSLLNDEDREVTDPWIIAADAIEITEPDNAEMFELNNHEYIEHQKNTSDTLLNAYLPLDSEPDMADYLIDGEAEDFTENTQTEISIGQEESVQPLTLQNLSEIMTKPVEFIEPETAAAVHEAVIETLEKIEELSKAVFDSPKELEESLPDIIESLHEIFTSLELNYSVEQVENLIRQIIYSPEIIDKIQQNV